MTPMRINSFDATIAQLKTRAKMHNIAIRKYERGEDSYILVDMATNAVVATYPLTKEQVESWLDDLDDQDDE